MDTWKKYILNRGDESTSIAALACFKLGYFSILRKFSLENKKTFSVKMNSKPQNCVRWTIAFFSMLLSNEEVIGLTEVHAFFYKKPVKGRSTESLWFGFLNFYIAERITLKAVLKSFIKHLLLNLFLAHRGLLSLLS